MQESARTREWPLLTAWGVVNILTGGLLLLPPVGRYFRARRERRDQACRGDAREMLGTAREFLKEGDQEAAAQVLDELDAKLQGPSRP